jgi:uncharacterized protein
VLRATSSGVELDVRVIPRARRTEAAGVRDGALVIRLAAPPVEGAANDALIDFVAGTLGVARRAVEIRAGGRGRRKRLSIAGVTEDRVRTRLGM